MIDLNEIIESAVNLEPLSATVSRLATIVTQEDVDLREVVDVVSYDQALTARLLKTANSALCSGNNSIATVKDAVIRLGSGTVLSFAIASSIKGRMVVALPEYGLAEGELWKHSVTSALAAEVLKPQCRRVPVPPESFTAALLHDIGKLVLARFLDREVLKVFEEARTAGEASLLRAETETLGVNHAELGALVTRHWELPNSIVHGVKFHHTPNESHAHLYEYANGGGRSEDAMDALVALVHLADAVSHRLSDAAAGVGAQPEIQDGALATLGIGSDFFEKSGDRISDRVETLLSTY